MHLREWYHVESLQTQQEDSIQQSKQAHGHMT